MVVEGLFCGNTSNRLILELRGEIRLEDFPFNYGVNFPEEKWAMRSVFETILRSSRFEGDCFYLHHSLLSIHSEYRLSLTYYGPPVGLNSYRSSSMLHWHNVIKFNYNFASE